MVFDVAAAVVVVYEGGVVVAVAADVDADIDAVAGDVARCCDVVRVVVAAGVVGVAAAVAAVSVVVSYASHKYFPNAVAIDFVHFDSANAMIALVVVFVLHATDTSSALEQAVQDAV